MELSTNKTDNRVCLIVIDGWGISPQVEAVEGKTIRGDAIAMAKTPNMDYLFQNYPNTELEAHGSAVGLLPGQMGNSEVGHLNIGAGRVVLQDIMRIENDISKDTMVNNPALAKAFDHLKDDGSFEKFSKSRSLHFVGLLSDGGVHSQQRHLFHLIDCAKRVGISNIYVHAITDGRDTNPESAPGFLKDLQKCLISTDARLATICGRFYAMDRDRRWERTQIAYDAFTTLDSIKAAVPFDTDLSQVWPWIETNYKAGVRDEFFAPLQLYSDGNSDTPPNGRIKDGDSIIFFNYRSDRMRQIVSAFAGITSDNDGAFKRLSNISIVCMTRYNETFPFPILSAPTPEVNVLAQWLSTNNVGQVHVAETEKYAHVTFFFNGRREEPFEGEVRKLIPSPKVRTYDLKPEMSVSQVADKVIEAIRTNAAPFIMCNFAPPDMVGHTGNLNATIAAVEATDAAIGKVYEACKRFGVTLVITADHGNAEIMIAEDGSEHTAHTCQPVPLIITEPSITIRLPSDRNAALSDVAPTILSLMKISKPDEMTGASLIDPLTI